VVLLVGASICCGQDSDQEILELAEPLMEELEQPWPTKCDDWAVSLINKRLLVTAIHAVSTVDSARGDALLSKLMDQFDGLGREKKQLYSPVISRVAVLSIPGGQDAVERWRRADTLSAAAVAAGKCAGNIIAEWRLKVRLEGIVVLTRAGLGEDDATDRTAWLDEAKQMAHAVGRPELAPVDESEPSDHDPGLIESSTPVYSENARRAGLEGEVVVKITVDEFGDVSHAEIMKSVHPALDEAAMAAARECRFSPGRRRGVPVKAIMAIPYTFKLEESEDR
jgi:TonB family protein